jgi:hypothetical protein
MTTGPGGFELTPGRVQAFGSTLLVPVRAGDGTLYVYESDYAQAAPIAPDLVFGRPAVGYATVRGTTRLHDGQTDLRYAFVAGWLCRG